MPEALHFTGNAEADRLIAAEPLALLIGFVLDQQVTVPTAFLGPLKLQQRFGGLDAGEIARTDPDRLWRCFARSRRSTASPATWRSGSRSSARSSTRTTTATPARVWRRRRRHGRSEAADRGPAGLRRDEGEGARLGARAPLRERDGRAARPRPRDARRRRLARGAGRVPGREARLQGRAARPQRG